MPVGLSTLIVVEEDHRGVVDVLTDLGFRFETATPESVTVLDTFDGRFHRNGLWLTLHEGQQLAIVLDGDDVVTTGIEPTKAPRFVRDLAPGPFRSRLEAIADVRALLPQLRISATRTMAVCRDDEGRVVATAVFLEHPVVDQATAAATLPALVIEVRDVIGARKSARRAVEALENLGLVAIDGRALTYIAGIAGVDLGGYVSSATVPLDSAMPAAEGVRHVLVNLADSIEANWQGTVDHVDPEFLHDLRIAVRRTRSVITQTTRVLPPHVVSEAADGFGWLGGLTGPARDLDVYLIEWDDYVRPLGATATAALAPIRGLLEQRQAAAHATLDNAMSSAAAAALMQRWQSQLAESASNEHQGPHAARPLGQVVRRRITRAHEKLIDRGRLITPDTPAEQVHDLRKDAKKLRYLLECFGSLLADGPRKQFVKRLKALQDNLGEHQDAEVHVALIREIASDLHEGAATTDTLLALGQLMERLEQIRIAARAEFAEQFAAYDTSATEHAFAAMLDFLDS